MSVSFTRAYITIVYIFQSNLNAEQPYTGVVLDSLYPNPFIIFFFFFFFKYPGPPQFLPFSPPRLFPNQKPNKNTPLFFPESFYFLAHPTFKGGEKFSDFAPPFFRGQKNDVKIIGKKNTRHDLPLS